MCEKPASHVELGHARGCRGKPHKQGWSTVLVSVRLFKDNFHAASSNQGFLAGSERGRRKRRKVLWAPTASKVPSGERAAQDCCCGRGSEGTEATAFPVSASYTMIFSSSR